MGSDGGGGGAGRTSPPSVTSAGAGGGGVGSAGSSCRTGGSGGGGGGGGGRRGDISTTVGSTATSRRSWAASNSSTSAPASRAARCRGRTGSCTPSMASQPWSPMVKRRPGSPVSTDGTTTVPTAALGRRARSSSRRRSDRSPGGTADTITSGSHASGVAPTARACATLGQRSDRSAASAASACCSASRRASPSVGADPTPGSRSSSGSRPTVTMRGWSLHGAVDSATTMARSRPATSLRGPSTVTTPPVSSSTSSSVPWSVVPTATSVGAGAAACAAVWASSAIGAPVTHREPSRATKPGGAGDGCASTSSAESAWASAQARRGSPVAPALAAAARSATSRSWAPARSAPQRSCCSAVRPARSGSGIARPGRR